MQLKRIFLVFSLCICCCAAYKPVVLMHGVLSGAGSMDKLAEVIAKLHPGTTIYNCDIFKGWRSLESDWRQVPVLRDYLAELGQTHPEGINVLGHSQGGILARAAIQSLGEHNVKTFISLSSPQAGQYGAKFLHLIFPDLAAKNAYELFYSHAGSTISVGGYWNDPSKHELYLKYSNFLPIINNELKTSNSTQFRDAIIRLERMVLIGGPDDGVITPWQSSHFGYYDDNLNVVPLQQRTFFQTDAIGLQTLEREGKLIIIIEPHVQHLQWHREESVIRRLILPYLD